MAKAFLVLSDNLHRFLLFPLPLRAGFAALALLVLCLALGQVFLFLMSAVPLALNWLFHKLYLVLDWPTARLHKILGGSFYLASNALSSFGEKVVAQLTGWYNAWHKPNRKYIIRASLILCGVCYIVVVLPSFFHIEENNRKSWGMTTYLRAESYLTLWLEEQSRYVSVSALDPANEEFQEFDQILQVSMTVVRANTLRVRNIPSTLDAEILETLKNGDVVFWNGEFAFGITEVGQEAWVKVTTASGVEGWSRLYYLQAEEVSDTTFSFMEEMTPQI